MDKSLALIFGKPPTFHPAMNEEIPLPNIQDLLSYQPHLKMENHSSDSPEDGADRVSTERTSLFGAHFLRQMHLLSKIMSDIWTCVFDSESMKKAEDLKSALESWHQSAVAVSKIVRRGSRGLFEQDIHHFRSYELYGACMAQKSILQLAGEAENT